MAAKALAQKAGLGTSSASDNEGGSISLGTIGMTNAQRQDYDRAKSMKNEELR